MSSSSFPISLDYSSSSFLEKLVESVRLGHGMTPFIGSGLSANSGIIMGQDFTEYLAYTVFRIAGGEGPPLDIARLGWPEFPDQKQVQKTVAWYQKAYSEICSRFNLIPEYTSVPVKVRRFASISSKGSVDQDERKIFSYRRSSIGRPLIPTLLRPGSMWEEEMQLRALLDLWKAESESFLDQNFTLNSREAITELAIRESCDWRAQLEFIARVQVRGNRFHLLSKPDTAIIDAFNTHITRDKQPCLGHKMIAQLSRSLRTRMILTTNFDDLLERSFADLRLSYETIPVSRRGRLPDYKTVRSKDSIVKLHGSLLETRADFSLDDLPQPVDFQNFLKYFRGSETGRGYLKSHFLITGYSGNDRRCVELIKHCLARLPWQRVFWICYNNADLEQLRRLFPEAMYSGKIIATVNSRPDMLLYELYQQLNISLPSGGFSYHASAGLPPDFDRLANEQHRGKKDAQLQSIQQEFEKLPILGLEKAARSVLGSLATSEEVGKSVRQIIQYQLVDCILSCLKERKHNTCKVFEDYFLIKGLPDEFLKGLQDAQKSSKENYAPAICVHQRSGSVHVAADLVAKLEGSEYRKKTIWIEMQDFADVTSLAHEIFTQIAIRSGIFQLEHVAQMPKWPASRLASDEATLKSAFQQLDAHLNLLKKHISLSENDWVLLFYGRSVPGSCSAWGHADFVWDKDQHSLFYTLLHVLEARGIQSIYFPMDATRLNQEERRIERCKNARNSLLKSLKKDLRVSDQKVSAVGDVELGAKVIFVPEQHEEHKKWHDDVNISRMYSKTIEESLERFVKGAWDDRQAAFSIDVARRASQSGPRTVLPDSYPQDEAVCRMVFLFAASLFRHSRHPSALVIDGVQEIPYRYLARGMDNDRIRWERMSAWSQELKKLNVFIEKPGGFLWMHRDVRLGIQQIYENLPFVGNLVAKNFRTGIHLSIASWYMKAFITNNHWIPAIENLYHLFKAAQNVPHAIKPNAVRNEQDLVRFRYTQLCRIVSEMGKSLEFVRSSFRFWLSSPSGHPIFDDKAIGLVEKELTHARDSLVKQPFLSPHEASVYQTRFERDLQECLEMLRVTQAITRTEKDTDGQRRLTPSPLSSKILLKELGPHHGRGRAFEKPVMPSCNPCDIHDHWTKVWLDHFNGLGIPFVEQLVAARAQFLKSPTKFGDIIAALKNANSPWPLDSDPWQQIHRLESLLEFAYQWARHAKFLYHHHGEPKFYYFSAARDPEKSKKLLQVTTAWLMLTNCCYAILANIRTLPFSTLQHELEIRSQTQRLLGFGFGKSKPILGIPS